MKKIYIVPVAAAMILLVLFVGCLQEKKTAEETNGKVSPYGDLKQMATADNAKDTPKGEMEDSRGDWPGKQVNIAKKSNLTGEMVGGNSVGVVPIAIAKEVTPTSVPTNDVGIDRPIVISGGVAKATNSTEAQNRSTDSANNEFGTANMPVGDTKASSAEIKAASEAPKDYAIDDFGNRTLRIRALKFTQYSDGGTLIMDPSDALAKGLSEVRGRYSVEEAYLVTGFHHDGSLTTSYIVTLRN